MIKIAIAEDMEGTVCNILYNLLGKFNLNDRIQLVAYAVKNRII